jgi:hypothetical protein
MVSRLTLTRMNLGIYKAICKRFETGSDGRFVDQVDVILALHELGPDLAEEMQVSEMITR